MRDARGNLTPELFPVGQPTDGARPVLLSAQTGGRGQRRPDRRARLHLVRAARPRRRQLRPVRRRPPPASRSRACGPRTARTSRSTWPSRPAHDTGSKPNLTYLGDAPSIRDAAGLEPEERTWAGLTVDALDPRLVSATTGDTRRGRRARLDRGALLGDGRPRAGGHARLVHRRRLHDPQRRGRSGRHGRAEASAVGQRRHGRAAGRRLHAGRHRTTCATRPATSPPPDRSPRRPTARGRCCSRRRPPTSTTTASWTASPRAGRSRSTHADDSAAPFPLSVESSTVARVHAAAGQTLDIDLVEPAAPDTGSAPDLTYTGGADPIRDAAGLEPAQMRAFGPRRATRSRRAECRRSPWTRTSTASSTRSTSSGASR